MRGEEKIWVQNRQRKFKVDTLNIKKKAALILKILEKETDTLSLLFVNDRAIQKLNLQFRNVSHPTDVLSFPMNSKEVNPEYHLLGDVVISVETARKQAEKLGHSLEKEITFLLTHGVLHLLGWDHERSPQEAKKMYKKQKEILAILEK